MIYDPKDTKLTAAPVRIGIVDEGEHLIIADSAADFLARKDYVVVCDYLSRAAVACSRQDGKNIVVCRSDWKPRADGNTLNPSRPARVWDVIWDASLQVVVTASDRMKAVARLSTHVLTIRSGAHPGAKPIVSLRNSPVSCSQTGDVEWNNWNSLIPLLKEFGLWKD